MPLFQAKSGGAPTALLKNGDKVVAYRMEYPQ